MHKHMEKSDKAMKKADDKEAEIIKAKYNYERFELKSDKNELWKEMQQ